MGISIPHGPINWRPRAILKNREINDLDFATCQLKLLVLRTEIELDWEDIQRDIWVRFVNFEIGFRLVFNFCLKIRLKVRLSNVSFVPFF